MGKGLKGRMFFSVSMDYSVGILCTPSAFRYRSVRPPGRAGYGIARIREGVGGVEAIHV